ncbi:MAG: ParB/RepB/Spo0J family partition protein [Gammaproteobacteria bacterium]|nr:ParB/RepB/Spo0J family partition protein [Gammaproteobacteria bacterium]MDH4255076.1 ParB/RepB/Spo0J family partition protein [Gammaproteobacteria bacterium]MDH5309570.1 ParB/RepB/Spo0J family partition protein [Gammaproteobacteria bacterium]
MVKKKRLGRGLDALLSKPLAETTSVGGTATETDRLKNIPVELLQRGQYQPRVDMRQDTLEDLASSIRVQGIVQPIVVRPLPRTADGTQRYEIVAGERRWRAAQLAGLADVPAVVREVEDDAAIAMALIENIQRENLNPLEEATALDRLIREFELTHQQAAEAVGRSRASVSNLLRLLELSDRVRPLVESRQLEMGHARALLSITDRGRQYEAAQEVIKKGLSVRETEQLVKRYLGGGAKKAKAAAQTGSADIRRLEAEISDKLGARVRIDHSAKGFGKLVINYHSLDELDGILKHIK